MRGTDHQRLVTYWGGAYILDKQGQVWNLIKGKSGSFEHPEAVDQSALGDAKVVSIAGGSTHALVLDSNGQVWAWGSNTYGALGCCALYDEDGLDLEHPDQPAPVAVDLTALEGAKVVAIDASHHLSVALDELGRVWAWGAYWGNALWGTFDPGIPKQVDLNALEGAKVMSLSYGDYHLLLLDETGQIWASGDNDYGQLGIGYPGQLRCNAHAVFCRVDQSALGGDKVVAIQGARRSSLALDASGRVWAWGVDWSGSLGTGDPDPSLDPSYVRTPTQVQFEPGVAVSAISALGTSDALLALDGAGQLWEWGGLNMGFTNTPERLDQSVLGDYRPMYFSANGTVWLEVTAVDEIGRLWSWDASTLREMIEQVDDSAAGDNPWLSD
ncbi:MAG: hypothetical protein P8171_18425 [Candidatus Thiodiazotropha sp.]